MHPDLEADTDALRQHAAAVASTGARITEATAAEPVPDPTPRWAAVGAATLAAEAARRQLALLGAEVTETARLIDAARAEYELADARAVTRLRLTR